MKTVPPKDVKQFKERIHILGVGNIGRLFAHALANEPDPPPVTLLLKPSQIEQKKGADYDIELTVDGVPNRGGKYDVDVISSKDHSAEPRGSNFIRYLIVSTKALDTQMAIHKIKHRLTSDSTIMFTQNGMGMVEEVNKEFGRRDKRPHFLACVTCHGVLANGPFSSTLAGRGEVAVGRVGNSESSAPQYLIDKVVSASLLAAREVSSQELLLLRLEKLIYNAAINPLSVIFNCRNGELFKKPPAVKFMQEIVRESIQIIRAQDGYSKDDPAVEARFSQATLQDGVIALADKTANNTSSMLQDVRYKRKTEIDYINGYLALCARKKGISSPVNELVVNLVRYVESTYLPE